MDGLPNLLTEEAREAIASKTGPVFEAMIRVAMRDNPSIATRAAAVGGLEQLLGPRSVEELFLPLIISVLPCVVDTEGRRTDILERDPYLVIMRVANYRIVRKCIFEQFPDIETIRHLRAAYIAEGGNGEDFNRFFIERYHAMIANLNARAQKKMK